jgi:hypothetical protein
MNEMVERVAKGATEYELANDFATEILDSFTKLHPAVLMSWNEWSDLREMIERQWIGEGMCAADLVYDPLYTAHRRRG